MVLVVRAREEDVEELVVRVREGSVVELVVRVREERGELLE